MVTMKTQYHCLVKQNRVLAQQNLEKTKQAYVAPVLTIFNVPDIVQGSNPSLSTDNFSTGS